MWPYGLAAAAFLGGVAYDPKEGYRTYTSSLFINVLCAEEEEKSPRARPRRVISNLFLHFIGEMQNLAELLKVA